MVIGMQKEIQNRYQETIVHGLFSNFRMKRDLENSFLIPICIWIPTTISSLVFSERAVQPIAREGAREQWRESAVETWQAERFIGHASKIKPWRNYEIERPSVVVVCAVRGEMYWCVDVLMSWIHLPMLQLVVVIYQSDYSVSSAKMSEKSATPQSVGAIQKVRETVSIPSVPASLPASPPSDVPLPHPTLYLKLSSHEYARNYKYGDIHQQTCNGVCLLVSELRQWSLKPAMSSTSIWACAQMTSTPTIRCTSIDQHVLHTQRYIHICTYIYTKNAVSSESIRIWTNFCWMKQLVLNPSAYWLGASDLETWSRSMTRRMERDAKNGGRMEYLATTRRVQTYLNK